MPLPMGFYYFSSIPVVAHHDSTTGFEKIPTRKSQNRLKKTAMKAICSKSSVRRYRFPNFTCLDDSASQATKWSL